MTVTFDGVTLRNPEPINLDHQPIVTDTILLSGKHSLQASSETAIACTINCHTETASHVSDLRAKIGTEGSLVIDSDTYTKCRITSWSESQWAKGKYEYSVGFKQDTT